MKPSKRWWSRVLGMMLVGVVLVAAAGCSRKGGQEIAYPTKPIDLIVAFPPGGGADVAARLLAPFAAKVLGQPVNVINKPGGSGSIGTQETLTAKPDGYTLMMDCHASASMLAVALPNLPYDWKNRTWIGRFCLDPVFFVVKADSPWKTLRDVVDAARKDPASFKWGTTGAAGISTFAIAQLFSQCGVDLRKTNMVVFQGGAPTLAALAGGHIDFAAQQLTEIQSLALAGKIRPLAVILSQRCSTFPDVPTCAEAGFPGLTVVGWQGVSGPPGLPDIVVRRWTEVLQKAAEDPELLQQAAKVGKTISVLKADDFRAAVMKEYETYRTLQGMVQTGK